MLKVRHSAHSTVPTTHREGRRGIGRPPDPDLLTVDTHLLSHHHHHQQVVQLRKRPEHTPKKLAFNL